MMDETESDARPLVTYKWTPRGYHLFTFYESSKAAMDQWFELAKPVMEAVQGTPMFREIYDQRKSGLQPMAYSNQKAKELMALYPVSVPFRLAVVVGSGGFFGHLINNFMNMLVSRDNNEIRIFSAHQFDEAEAWVMQETTEIESQEADSKPQ
jgi:hypothetical protein